MHACRSTLEDPTSDLIDLMGGVEGSIRNDDENKLPATISSMVDATIARACCGNGVVDPGEECDDGNGNDGDCCSSTCKIEPATTVCRPSAGPCDTAERCTGTSPVCPADAKSTALCRGAANTCDVAESCDGVSNDCPADRFVVDGTSCNDGNACSRHDTCQGGVCTGGDPVTCTAKDSCHLAGSCDPTTGTCSNPVKADGSTCNDGNACTRQDTCQAGSCVGTNPVTCSAGDQCHVAGTCNPSTGVCSNPAKVNGSTCNDGNACTRQDTCQGGACVGGDPVSCAAQDSCHDAGTCNPATGICSIPVREDGSTCDDGDGCTQTDRCQGGRCIGTDPVTCTASDACHLAGTCDPATGTCSNPPQVDGTSCDDGTACTRSDACAGGRCVGSDAVTCPAPDQCHTAGTCDPATGTCSAPARPDGSTCDDGNACTQGDACRGGTCVGGPQVQCDAPDVCRTSLGCNPATGACMLVNTWDGTPCDDHDACTEGETCWGSMCKRSHPVNCDDADACTTDGCSRTSGCSHARLQGLDGVTCHCDNGLATQWCGNTVPAMVQKPFAKACKMLNRARGASPKKSRAFMRKAQKFLKKSNKASARAMKRHLITPHCAMDMNSVMGDATTRVKALTANHVRP